MKTVKPNKPLAFLNTQLVAIQKHKFVTKVRKYKQCEEIQLSIGGGGGVYGGIGGYMGGRKWLVSEGNTRVNCRYF